VTCPLLSAECAVAKLAFELLDFGAKRADSVIQLQWALEIASAILASEPGQLGERFRRELLRSATARGPSRTLRHILGKWLSEAPFREKACRTRIPKESRPRKVQPSSNTKGSASKTPRRRVFLVPPPEPITRKQGGQ